MASDDQRNMMVVAAIIVIMILLWYYYHTKSATEGMYPDYDYDWKTGVILQTGMTPWQATTQGYFPNEFVEKVPIGGEIIGKYDYLQKNISGRNLIPGDYANDMYYKGFTDCGCGCNGQKKAHTALQNVQPSASVQHSMKKSGKKDGWALPVQTSAKIATRNQSHFGAAPQDPINICNGSTYTVSNGTVYGRCADAVQKDQSPVYKARHGLDGFGAAPGDALAQTVGTVGNSYRSPASSLFYPQDPAASNMLVFTKEYHAAQRQQAMNQSSINHAIESTQQHMAKNPTKTGNKPKVNEHLDAKANTPRHVTAPAKKGIYTGINQESSIDERTR